MAGSSVVLKRGINGQLAAMLSVTIVSSLLWAAHTWAQPLVLPGAEIIGSQSNAGYASASASTRSATKIETPLRETPQNIQVVNSQLLNDIGALRLADTFNYVSGVAQQNSFGGLWDNFSMRGFSGDENTGPEVLRNGFAANRGFNAARDMANVERIEFLKGPASGLYGRSDPGGTLNVVTKKPQWQRAGKAKLSYGSYDARRVELDLTGPATERLAYRLNLALEDNHSFRDTVETQRELVAPALTFRASDQTTFFYDGEYLRQKAPLDRGVVAIDNKLGKLPVARFLGEPGDGPVRVQNQTHQVSMEHYFNGDWHTRLAAGYKQGSLDGFSTEPTALIDGRTLTRQRRLREYASDDYSLQAELFGRVEAGGVVHNLVIGADTYRFEMDQLMLRINPSADQPYAIDILNPEYGQAAPEPLPNTDRFERQKAHALYLQNQMELGERWRLLLGTRLDHYRQSLHNRRNASRTQQSATASSPRVGVVYLLNDQVSVYANASSSFRPNSGADQAGNAFSPEQGRSTELGVKVESADGRLAGTVALFDITKENVLTADPANPGFSIAAGEVQSRGLELDISGQLTERLRLTTSYAYLDARVSKDNNLAEGSRLLNIPRHSASLLAVHAVGRGGVGAGVNYVAQRSGDNQDSGFELPAYSTVKALAFYPLSPSVQLNLDVDNLLDRDHYVSSYSANWVTPGARRTVTGRIEYQF